MRYPTRLFDGKRIATLLLAVFMAGCGHNNSDGNLTSDGGVSVDTLPPIVSFTTPVNDATSVFVNSSVTATFSEAMTASTITATSFTLKETSSGVAVAGTVTYDETNHIARFTPATNLSASLQYTATVTTAAEDLAGNALAVNEVWSFTTGTSSDTTAPTVSSTLPADLATDVQLNRTVNATFSETMDSSTITSTSFTLADGGGTPVSGTVTYAGSTATFAPDSNLAASTTYTATITTAAKDLAGNALAASHIWTFTTGTTTASFPAAVNLGRAGDFVILAKSGISNVSTSAVVGDLGVSPIDSTAITGFALVLDGTNQFATSSQVTGKVFASDYANPTPAKLTTAVSDMETAYTDAAGRAPDVTELGSGNIGGRTLVSGVYKWGTGVTIPTDLTLSGSADDVWIFQISGTLDLASATKVVLAGGAQAKNVFWQVADIVTLGTNSHFEGIILGQVKIDLLTDGSINGRMLSQTAVNIQTSTVRQPAE